ncbi:MAG: alpha/beta hydrolase family protein [Calditrichaceae bacterium]
MNVILSIVFLSFTGIIALYIMFNYVLQKSFNLPHISNSKNPEDFGLEYKNLFLKTKHGKKIQIWDINSTADGPVIIGVHGWASTSEKLLTLTKSLEHRWRVVLLNCRNHGESDDDGYSSMIKFKEDLDQVAEYVRNGSVSDKRIVLLGHSLGGAASLYKAADDPRIGGVVTIGTFADLESFMREIFLKKKMPRGFANSILTFIEVRLGKKFSLITPSHTIKTFQNPVLVVHGDRDETVAFGNMDMLVKSANRGNVESLKMEGHSHSSLLTDPKLAEGVDQFIKKYF